MKIETHSLWEPGRVVSIDPYGGNPLLEDARAAYAAELLRLVVRDSGPAPRMFSGGTADLPPFTASGVNPRELLKVPYGARHFAAATPHAGQLLEIIEWSADDPGLSYDHAGFTEAVARFRRWLRGTAVRA